MALTITFQIHYGTQWGQQLAIVGSLPELGNDELTGALRMHHQADGLWRISLPLKKSPASFTYRYVILDETTGEVQEEWGDPRKVRIPTQGAELLLLQDWWRTAGHADNAFYTAAFRDVVFRTVSPMAASASGDGNLRMRFRLAVPQSPADWQLAVTGNVPELGSWDPARPLLLGRSGFPDWEGVAALNGRPALLEYKYGWYDPAAGKLVALEMGANRTFGGPVLQIPGGGTVVLTDEHYRWPGAPWKGAGVAIPVFSLRSEQSLGVGEFHDLKQMVDWAEITGLRMVQILPVNDTTANHTWTDSYPYSAITVFGLHPMFLHLDALPGIEKVISSEELAALKVELNAQPSVDYDTVIKYKFDLARKTFKATQATFLKSKAFKAFYAESKHWLDAYAVFSYLRDKYKNVDFRTWGKHAQCTPELLTTLCDPKAKEYSDVAFFFYLQFHLDAQLREATDYAREKGIVMKGDLPIGIYRHSVDAWFAPKLYHMDWQAGAPPDPFSATGQNWGFPTYNWEEMAKDGYGWWRQRMTQMSRYFDAYRIDHILGFFRIWQIPLEHVNGLLGVFNPVIPFSRQELQQRGIFFIEDRFCQPYITDAYLFDLFGVEGGVVRDQLLESNGDHTYRLKAQVATQRAIEAFLAKPENAGLSHLKEGLFQLTGDLLLIPADAAHQAFHPRIDLMSTRSYQELPPDQQQRLRQLHDDFFFRRHEEFWRDRAMEKLPSLSKATNMLICGEDLGMVPACVPGVMHDLGILSLEIQRMSKNPQTEFLQERDIPYLSVVSPSTHDMSPIRAWWEESERVQIRRFYHEELHMAGEPPFFCEPYVAEGIIKQHLHWPSMWAVFPLQDLLAMDGAIRRENPFEERINVPSNPNHYWRYRMHLTLEELKRAQHFNALLNHLLVQSGRA